MLNVIVAFLIAALMGTGIGGGGLFIIYLTLCLNFSQLDAQGTNLVFFILASLASLTVNAKRGTIDLILVRPMIIFGSLGSVVFSNLVYSLDPKVPRIALAFILILSGVYTICNVILKDKFKNIFKKVFTK